jgi:DNA adenine methylase
VSAKPFLRWAGGKTQLLSRILPYVPKRIGTYWEPFVGGGALFFTLASEEPRRFEHAVLADANEELINCYRQVRENVEGLIDRLVRMPATQEFFDKVRAKMDGGASRAVRFIYLNRCGFNGLWRVNGLGEYNVPFGRRANGKPIEVCPPEYAANLRACSRALQGVTLSSEDFRCVAPDVGDFVFADPPYLPVKTDSFAAYTSKGFGVRDHVNLTEILCSGLSSPSASFILCNADTAVARDIYRGMRTIRVKTRRSVSGKASGRKPARELMVVQP